MKTIIVDDEPIMIKSFKRLSAEIDSINIVSEFTSSPDALEYASDNNVELAVLDIEMPIMSGIELAEKLRAIRPDILIVFITAYDGYIHDANEVGADDYIVKPYKREIIERMAERMELLSKRLRKDIFIQTFGRFTVLKNGEAIDLTGKAKEILAIIVTKRGKEISNEEIYSMVWENRPYDNVEMKVYYNALRRLKEALTKAGVRDILQSTMRGQMVNTDLFDCDYYDLIDHNMSNRDKFSGEFMSEYSWGEYILTDLMKDYYE